MSYADDLAELTIPIFRYSLAMDEKRWDLMESVFTDDVIGFLGEHAPLVGRADVVAFIAAAINCCSQTHHMNSNVLAEVDGDTAEVTWRVRALHRDDAGQVFEVVGHYDATFARTPEGWRAKRWREESTPVGTLPPGFFDRAAETWAAIAARALPQPLGEPSTR